MLTKKVKLNIIIVSTDLNPRSALICALIVGFLIKRSCIPDIIKENIKPIVAISRNSK